MSIASGCFKLAVVVGGRLDSRKSEEEGRRAGSLEERVRSLRSTARNKSQVGPTAGEVQFAGGRSLSRQARRKECSEGSLVIPVAGECEAAVQRRTRRVHRLRSDWFFRRGSPLRSRTGSRSSMRVSIIKAVDGNLPSVARLERNQTIEMLGPGYLSIVRDHRLAESVHDIWRRGLHALKTSEMQFRFRVHNVILPYEFSPSELKGSSSGAAVRSTASSYIVPRCCRSRTLHHLEILSI